MCFQFYCLIVRLICVDLLVGRYYGALYVINTLSGLVLGRCTDSSIGYRQTSLVILPGENIFDVLNLNPVRYALKRIEAKVERGWLPRDNRSRHLDTIFKGTDADTARKVMSLLLQAALGTQDADLFVRAVNGCGVTTDLSRLNALGFMKALELFGVEKLHPMYVSLLSTVLSNSQKTFT